MRRFKGGKERSGRAIGEERERGFGGRETGKCRHYLRLHLQVKMCQNRLITGLCTDMHGDIMRSPRTAKLQWTTREGTIPHTPSHSFGRFAVGEGWEEDGQELDRELEGG